MLARSAAPITDNRQPETRQPITDNRKQTTENRQQTTKDQNLHKSMSMP
jgi:hypothetical protein